jgi:CRISPR-associated exonuclease Cas4
MHDETERQRDFIPISMLNALAYCPRRFAYEYIQAEMLVNEHVVEGQTLHESVDAGGRTWLEQGVQERKLYVWSATLGIAGIVDLLEWRDGQVRPIEYKRGKVGRWRNDQVQVCAQALCLEEMLSVTIQEGYLFSFATRRRETVALDAELRQWTMEVIAEAHRLSAEGRLPPPIDHRAKCAACSLQPLCLPDEVRRLSAVTSQ